jgi:two-component system cell cycle response regulator DivK
MAKRILVVEDGVDLRTVVVAVLKQVCGYETVEAANGKEAVEMAVSEKPDLILMDVDLPDISGIDADRAVKSNPRTAHIPIIAQTGWASKQWKTVERRAWWLIFKPVSVDLIISTIEEYI